MPAAPAPIRTLIRSTERQRSSNDSRLFGFNLRVTHPTLPLERTYCSLCGRPKGWVSIESSAHISTAEIIVICDICEQENGKPPMLREAPVKEY